MSQSSDSTKKFYQKPWFIFVCALFILGAIFGDDKKSKSSSSSSSSYSSSSSVKCGWCGKSFKKGSGYNTLMRLINTPETQYSKYCSRSCARSFLANN